MFKPKTHLKDAEKTTACRSEVGHGGKPRELLMTEDMSLVTCKRCKHIDFCRKREAARSAR